MTKNLQMRGILKFNDYPICIVINQIETSDSDLIYDRIPCTKIILLKIWEKNNYSDLQDCMLWLFVTKYFCSYGPQESLFLWVNIVNTSFYSFCALWFYCHCSYVFNCTIIVLMFLILLSYRRSFTSISGLKCF